MRTDRQHAGSSRAPAADVLQHLADSLPAQWRRYRKRLKRCQRHFSEEAVHDSRVETRRLLATVELLRAFLNEKDVRKARRALKRHLDTFDQLRDTQVQLVYVAGLTRAFPLARAFRDWLRRREARFAREARRDVKHIKARRLGRRLAAFEKELRRLHRAPARARALETALKAIDLAFDRVTRLSRRIRAENTATIHRTRIALKRVRYMIEALSPLLPAVTENHSRAMRGYQSMMGDIQDLEVLLAAFDEFVRGERADRRSARPLRAELQRRRRLLIRVCLNAVGKLRLFWPPPGLDRS
jgi:CHAD domain-containing protein